MSKKRKLAVLALFISTLVLSGCTPSSDPVLQQILSADLGELKPVSQEVRGYCYPTELFCPNPLFEPAFHAQSSVEPLEICDSVIDLQLQIGLVAYSFEGELAQKVDEVQVVRDLCTQGLAEPQEAEDGTAYYQGTVLFDDGTSDGVGKVTVISRREDGSYFVVFSISRNLDRVGWISYAD